MSDCVFCKIASGEIPAPRLYEDEHVFVIRDRAPHAPTHLLVIPREHHADVMAAEGHADLLGHCVATAGKVARQVGLPAFRLVSNNGAAAGQSVFHLHFHVLGGRTLKDELA